MLSSDLFCEGILVLALIYLGFAPCIARPLYRSMLFHPARFPDGYYDIESLDDIKAEDVSFSSADGTVLHAWFFKLPGQAKAILFHHGNAGNLTTRLGTIQLLLRAGVSVFVYDYRGFGKSNGVPALKGIVEDGCAAYDYLIGQGIAWHNLIHYGESLGAAVAAQVSSNRQSGGLIMQSGFSCLQEIGKEVAPWVRIYPSWLYPQPHLDSLSLVRKPHPPLLIMHGEKDAVVPLRHSEELFNKAVEPKTFIRLAGANHSDISMAEPQAYTDAVRQFLSSLQAAHCSACPQPGD